MSLVYVLFRYGFSLNDYLNNVTHFCTYLDFFLLTVSEISTTLSESIFSSVNTVGTTQSLGTVEVNYVFR